MGGRGRVSPSTAVAEANCLTQMNKCVFLRGYRVGSNGRGTMERYPLSRAYLFNGAERMEDLVWQAVRTIQTARNAPTVHPFYDGRGDPLTPLPYHARESTASSNPNHNTLFALFYALEGLELTA